MRSKIRPPKSPFCATRAIKNAKQIAVVAPHVFASVEPPDGFASVLPLGVLNRFHRMTDAELRRHPDLLAAAHALRAGRQTRKTLTPEPGLIFEDSPFQGTLYLAQITFNDSSATRFVNDADMAVMLQYLILATPAIARYTSQYGDAHLLVSPNILQLTVQVPSSKYNNAMLHAWLRQLLTKYNLPITSSCIIVCNPDGITNTDADLTDHTLGYHDAVAMPVQPPVTLFSPYCFVNVVRQNLTVADRRNQYAETMSHEIAEMAVDPLVSWTNPEVCDACAGNCSNEWLSFFAVDPAGDQRYLRSSRKIPPPPFTYDFFTAAVAHSGHADDCPAPESSCNYGPEARPGISELLFYESADGYGELYAVDDKAGLSLQTTHPDWRMSWNLIVPGVYTSKPAGSRLDILFYDRSAGVGEFYQTGTLGDMHRFSLQDDWRKSWSLIIPGSFAAAGSMDLLFYERTNGIGEFYRTDGHGNLTSIGATHTNWRTTWSQIIPGKFSNSPFTDLLFYDPIAGVGEFYRTDSHGNLTSIGAPHTNWRTTWSQIIPGKFSNSPFTDLLFYDPIAGVGEFYRTDGHGNLTSIGAPHTNWRTTWSRIIPGKFSNSPFTDLLFYDPIAGVGEFYRTNGSGSIVSIHDYTNWRTTWSIIDRL